MIPREKKGNYMGPTFDRRHPPQLSSRQGQGQGQGLDAALGGAS
jgi:hypothetical protein